MSPKDEKSSRNEDVTLPNSDVGLLLPSDNTNNSDQALVNNNQDSELGAQGETVTSTPNEIPTTTSASIDKISESKSSPGFSVVTSTPDQILENNNKDSELSAQGEAVTSKTNGIPTTTSAELYPYHNFA